MCFCKVISKPIETQIQGKDNRDSSLAELRTHLRNVFVRKDRNCLVIFPEGGFLRKRRAASSS